MTSPQQDPLREQPIPEDLFTARPFPTRVVGGIIAGIGVCCLGYVIVLAGGIAVFFGNPLVVVATVLLAAAALAAVGWRCLRDRGPGTD